MKLLFLHGWSSVPGGRKPTYLKDHGHKVFNPALPDDDFAAALRIAQAEFDKHQPDVVVGSSRGGAVAMNIDSKDTPLVLLCPAWKKWGTATTVKPNTVILHARADDVVPFADTKELLANGGLPTEAFIEVGNDHRLADRAAEVWLPQQDTPLFLNSSRTQVLTIPPLVGRKPNRRIRPSVARTGHAYERGQTLPRSRPAYPPP
jgi:hypothetical protein